MWFIFDIYLRLEKKHFNIISNFLVIFIAWFKNHACGLMTNYIENVGSTLMKRSTLPIVIKSGIFTCRSTNHWTIKFDKTRGRRRGWCALIICLNIWVIIRFLLNCGPRIVTPYIHVNVFNVLLLTDWILTIFVQHTTLVYCFKIFGWLIDNHMQNITSMFFNLVLKILSFYFSKHSMSTHDIQQYQIFDM